MSNVRLTWELPTVNPRQRPIQFTEISVRIDPAFPWTVQDNVAPDVAQEIVLFDVAPGDWYYQAVVIDIDGVRGAPVETRIAVPFDPPNTVTNFIATLE